MLTNKLDDSGRKMSRAGWQEEAPLRETLEKGMQELQAALPAAVDHIWQPQHPQSWQGAASGAACSPPAPPVGGETLVLSQPSHTCVARDFWVTLA